MAFWGEEEDIADYGLTKLHDAAENGDLDVIKALIGGGAPTSNVTVVKNADPNDVLDDSADSADSEEDDDDGDFTIETAEVDINARDKWRLTPIYAAVLGGQLPALKLLISKGARLDIRVEKSSLLHFVCAMGGFEKHVDFVSKALKALLDAKCKILLSDELVRSPLHIAAMHGLSECVDLLLSSAASAVSEEDMSQEHLLTHTDKRGWNVIHTAAAFGQDGIIEQILGKLEGDQKMKLLNSQDIHGRSPLHIAMERCNAKIKNILVEGGCSLGLTDKRDRNAVDVASEYGFDKNVAKAKTVVVYHGDYCKHLTAESLARNAPEPPPENVQRVRVLCNENNGLLRMSEFKERILFDENPPLATEIDVLRVHDLMYVKKLQKLCSSIEGPENTIAHLDADTALCKASFDVALRAAGAVIHAIDIVMSGEASNALCVVRPPGHHAGPRGVVTCANDQCGSHGFCLLNNVAIGAGYAKSVYRHNGVTRVAILDFDVHHGNGTEACIRNLVPTQRVVKNEIPGVGIFQLVTPSYKPWLDKHDPENIFFCSVHGYGKRDFGPGWFYPGSGITSAFSTRVREVNIGVIILESSVKMTKMSLSKEWRDTWRDEVFPKLEEFNPDLIFISAGFDAHRRDEMNHGHVQIEEPDYEWFTEHVVRISNKCCPGKVVSVLEGGYRVHGHVVSPFGRSVAGHLRSLSAPGTPAVTKELRDYERTFENHMEQKRLELLANQKREEEINFMRKVEAANAHAEQLVASGVNLEGHIPLKAEKDASEGASAGVADGDDANPGRPSRKRRRKEVDYVALEAQLKAQEKLGQ